MRRLNFNTDPIRRPRRAVHALSRRLGLCRWWLIQYAQNPRALKPPDILAHVQRLLEPERARLVRLASLYDQAQPVQYALFDPVTVLPELRPHVRRKDLAAWLLVRADVATQVNEHISRNAEARWRATRDGDALVEMVSSGQLTEPWLQQALVELQAEELGEPDTARRTQAARVLRRVGRALLRGGRGRRSLGQRQSKRPHNAVTQARSRRKTKLIGQVQRRERQGEDRTTVATEVLYRFVTGHDRILDSEQRRAVAREVKTALGL